METAANRHCEKDFATDVGDFSEVISHDFRRQKPASVMAYAAVGSDKTKSSHVFIEWNVKANSAGYRENAGRKRVSVVKNAYENRYLNQRHHPKQCTNQGVDTAIARIGSYSGADSTGCDVSGGRASRQSNCCVSASDS